MIQAVDFGLLPVLRFMEDIRMNVIDISQIKNEVQKTICFTGHRPNKLAGYTSRVPYTVFVKNLKEMLIPLVEQGYIRFITGGAQGIDQLAFWAVEGLKAAGYAVKNIVFVPYEGQELRWSEKGMFSRQEYKRMLEKADGVVYLYRKGQSFKVVDALMERNHAMCDVSDKLIGVYEGIDFRNEKGGTAECLRYAEKMYLETTILRFTA